MHYLNMGAFRWTSRHFDTRPLRVIRLPDDHLLDSRVFGFVGFFFLFPKFHHIVFSISIQSVFVI